MSRDQRLVWRELSQALPNVAPFLAQANEGFNNAAEAAGSILERYQSGREAIGDREAARRLAGINDEAEFDSFLANGGLADLQISKEMQANLMNMRGTALGYQNNRSIINDRDTRTGLAVNADGRLQDLHGVAMTDHEWRQGARAERAGLSGAYVADRLHGQTHGTTGGAATASTGGEDFSWLQMQNQGAIRSGELSPELIRAMSFLGDMGIQFRVNSGGQNPGKGTGSARHNHGNAADGDLYMGDTKLDWNNPQHVPILQEVVARARLNGVTGIGGSNSYMGAGRMHFGFGNEAVWGGQNHTREGLLADGGSWLADAFDNPQQYANRSGQFTPQSASAAVSQGANPRGALMTALANSKYLDLTEIEAIMTGSDTFRAAGDKQIMEDITQRNQDIAANIFQERMADPNILNQTDFLQALNEDLAASGNFSDAERLQATKWAEGVLAESSAFQEQLSPSVTQDVAATNIIAGAEADMRQGLQGSAMGRIQVDTQRFKEAEDPIVELEQMLNLDTDGQSAGWWGGLLSKGKAGYDRNELRNLVDRIASDNRITEAQAAAVAREIFVRDPLSFVGFNANTLENRFEIDDAAEMARQVLNPDAQSRFGDANRRAAEIQQDLQEINKQILEDQQRLEKTRDSRARQEIQDRITAGITQMTAMRAEARSLFSEDALLRPGGGSGDPAEAAIAEAAARRAAIRETVANQPVP